MKKGAEAPFQVTVIEWLEARSEVDAQTHCRVIQKHVHIQLWCDVKHIFEIDVTSSVDAEVKVVDGVVQVKTHIVVTHEVLTSNGEIQCIKGPAKIRLGCNDNVIRNCVTHSGVKTDARREHIEQCGGITRAQVPRALRLACILTKAHERNCRCEERKNNFFHKNCFKGSVQTTDISCIKDTCRPDCREQTYVNNRDNRHVYSCLRKTS